MGGKALGVYLTCIIDTFAESAGRDAVIALCEELGIPPTPQQKVSYPVKLFNLLVEEGTARFWPKENLKRSFYLHGVQVSKVFAKSLAGSVSMRLSGKDIKKFASGGPRFAGLANDFGSVKYVDVSEKAFRFEFRDFETSPHFQHGLLTTVMQTLMPDARITMNILKFKRSNPGEYMMDADYLIELP